MGTSTLRIIGVALLGAVLCVQGGGCQGDSGTAVELTNVSYDPTRELYVDLNKLFIEQYKKDTGTTVKITQSHGGSGAQARAVIDGLKADVVTLALAGDIDAIQKRGLIQDKWQDRLANNSSPYLSTIVLVVRQGNPKNIKDWPDLIRDDVEVITPNPKTSGGARWNFLAAWGYVAVHQKKGEDEAKAFIQKLFGRVIKLDTGARGASETFVKRKQGDVLISWENEALLVKGESAEEGLEIVYPSVTILAEPPVAVVDKYVDEKGTRALAEAYLNFLSTDAAQEVIGQHGYRPSRAAVLQKFADKFPAMTLFTLKEVSGDWATAQKKFFADGGVFDQIYQPK